MMSCPGFEGLLPQPILDVIACDKFYNFVVIWDEPEVMARLIHLRDEAAERGIVLYYPEMLSKGADCSYEPLLLDMRPM